MDIMDMSVVKLAEKIRNREVSAMEVTKESLKKIKEDASSINSFITIDEENAIKRAKYVQKQIDSGNINSLVAGVVVGIKDNICTKGLRTTCGSKILENFVPTYNAQVIDNLEKAVDAKTEDENYKQGVELVLKQLKDVLALNGVKEIETIGKTFDPELHEAVASVTDENLGEKEIKEEYRKGYILGSKVIRHSMVVVAN